MAFAQVNRLSLEVLSQNYRAPGVSPGSVPPGRGAAADPQDRGYAVADDFIRVVPFVRADQDGRPLARQYQVGLGAPLFEPEFTSRTGGSSWQAGGTAPFGEGLTLVGSRFKKLSVVVRADSLMTSEGGDDMLGVQTRLARVAIVRALSEALLFSVPANDDQAELAGLPYYLSATGGQDVAYDPSRRLIGGLSEIEARCCPGDGDFGAGPDALVMSSRARWRLLKELEDRGITPDYRLTRLTHRPTLHFHGVPVLVGRVPEPAGPAPKTDAWAVKLFGPSAIRVIHVGGTSSEYGLRTRPGPLVASIDGAGEARSASAGVEVFGVFSVLVPEEAAIARLRGIPSRDPFIDP